MFDESGCFKESAFSPSNPGLKLSIKIFELDMM